MQVDNQSFSAADSEVRDNQIKEWDGMPVVRNESSLIDQNNHLESDSPENLKENDTKTNIINRSIVPMETYES